MGRGFGISTAVALDVAQQVAAEAERLGYSSFWVNNSPGSDGLATLEAAAAVTSNLHLGVGVIPLDSQPADGIIANVRARQLPQERLWLGIGSGGDRKGLSRVRDGVAELHAALTCEVVISALGPKMTALAGEVAEGVLFNWFTPAYEQSASEQMHAASVAAGRTPTRRMAYVRCALLPQAAERLEVESGRYARIPSYANHFERMGVAARDTAVSGPDASSLQRGIAEHEAVLDETVVRAITADDSLDSLLELLRACAPNAAEAGA